MLTKEQNELLTQVGPGTPCGELLRRYWHPIAGASELMPERPKMRLRILGENLVLFRNPDGSHGLLAEHCSHRGTSLYYGFLEDGGIRCPYHGWLYDSEGKCLEQPFEPRQSMLRHVIRHTAYPVQKLGGFLWAYMGPHPAPLLPRWDILTWEVGARRIEIRPVLNCSWLQAEENTVDITHTYFLHAYTMASKGRPNAGGGFGRPFYRFGFQPYRWGVLKSWTYGGPNAENGWGILLVFPNMLRLGNAMHWRVPIDDTHTRILRVEYAPPGSVDLDAYAVEGDPPVRYEPTWIKPDGEYHLDTFSSQDGMAWETAGPILDRTQEHLGAADAGVAMLRQMLFESIEAVQRGDDPFGVIRDAAENEYIDLGSWMTDRADGAWRMNADGEMAARLPREEVFDERHAEFEIPPGSARSGVAAHLAEVSQNRGGQK